MVRLGRMVGTLLGPEGTTRPGCWSGVVVSVLPGMAWGHTGRGFAVLVSRGGLWVGCGLRIAQWTRASCFLWFVLCG